MNNKFSIKIKFAEIRVEFIFPGKVNLPEAITRFKCDDSIKPDASYRVQLIEQPLHIEHKLITLCDGVEYYPYQNGILRIFPQLIMEDGCQVACFIGRTRENVLYYPLSKWDFFARELHFLHLMGVERLLLPMDAFILHSSFVEIEGCGILFSGPSGVGKSTQSELWRKYLNAEILNGDRCVIRKIGKDFLGCGSPWAGTSKIYIDRCVPIKGIFILQQGKKNIVRRIKAEAFIRILQQTVVNAWDEEFYLRITELIAELLQNIPVYELACTPNEEAVKLAYKTIFKGDM